MISQSSQMEQKFQELQQQLEIRERDLSEIKEAYKEKNRKCQAWEKVHL